MNGWLASLYDLRSVCNGVYLANKTQLTFITPPAGSRLLDVGCGTGKILSILRQKYPTLELYGIDPARDMISEATKKFPEEAGVFLQCASARALPFADTHFDWVISGLTLHHIARRGKTQAIQEMHRVLRPGGTLLITDFGTPRTSWGHFLGILLSLHAYAPENVSGVLEEELTQSSFEAITTKKIQSGIVHHIQATK